MDIDERARLWMSTCPIPEDDDSRTRLLNSHSAAYVACCSPHGIDERLELGGKWFLYAFAMDDWFETRTSLDEIIETCAIMQQMLENPGAPPLTDLPFTEHFAELIRGFRRYATDIQYDRIVTGYRTYHQGIPWEASYRIAGSPISPTVHPVIRAWSTGFNAFLSALEVYNDLEIPGNEYAQPAARTLREITGLLLTWVNDFFSADKDRQQGGGQNSLVTALMDHHGYSLTEATVEAITTWNRVMDLYLRLRNQLAVSAGPALSRFLEDTGNMITNVIHWHAGNPRYGSQPPMAVTANPPAPFTGPLPNAVIRSWWDHLTTPDARFETRRQ
ncbi:hypothetical protein [Nocardia sp. NPDC052566]|uniref:terpene synthase family protein n=1 Tax=Nocardia sp. NPDC052566 TaxID=3364330 RepID=UPI0037C64AC4